MINIPFPIFSADIYVCDCTKALSVLSPTEKEKPQQTPQPERAPPPVTTRRAWKKLSEPHPSDIINAVLMSAGKKSGSAMGLQRAHSFSPRTLADAGPGPLAGPAGPVIAGRGGPGEGADQVMGSSSKGPMRVVRSDVDTDSAGQPVDRYTVQWTDNQGRTHADPSSSSPSSSALPTTTTTTTTPDPASVSKVPPPAAMHTTTSTPATVDEKDGAQSRTTSLAKSHSLRSGASAARPHEQSPSQSSTALSVASGPRQQQQQSPRSMVSQLRAQFSQLEQSAESGGGGKGAGGGGGIRRWHSMPLKQERPTVVQVRATTRGFLLCCGGGCVPWAVKGINGRRFKN